MKLPGNAYMDHTIRKASRRIAIDLAVRRGAVGWLIGAVVGLGALVLDRLAGLALSPALFAAIVATSVLIAVSSALLRPPDRMETAVRLDRGLGLKDRLGTAEALRQGMVSGEFAELVRADAERTAAGLDVAAATPIRIGGPWPVGLALAALLAAAIAWVPPLRRSPGPEAANEALDEQRVEIAGAIDQAVAGADPDLLDETSREDIEALDALAKQLAGGDAPPKRLSEARDESAATMEAVADRLDESAQRNLEALDELTRRVTSFEPPAGASPPEELTELLDKLRRGELEEAARQAEEASALNQERSPEENRELAESLDSLARHLRRPETEEQAQQEEREKVLEALKDLGMDEAAAEQALQSEDRRALEEALAESGADPETAREMSRDIEELNQDRETREASEALREHLAEALQDAARELEGKDAAPHGEDQSGDPQPQPARQEQSQQPEQPGAAESQAQPEQGDRSDEGPQPAHDGETHQRQVQPASGESESQQERQAPRRQDGQEQEQEQRQSQPQGTQPEGTQPGRQGREDQQQPTGREGDQQQQQPTGREGDQQQQQPAGPRSLSQALRDLERVRREAQGQRALSKELQETARRLADNLTEEERQRLAAQWMQSGRGPGSQVEGLSPDRGRPPGDEALFDAREDVDLRDEDATKPGRSVARWSDPEGGPPDSGPGQAAPAAGRAAAQRARTEAEQAVERAAVPSRYHRLIRRYFNKLAEPAPPAAPAGAPPDGAHPAPGNGGTP